MFDFVGWFLAPLVLILDIIAIFDVMTGPKDTIKRVSWVAVILLLPALGLILYYLFGKENLLERLKHQ